MMVGILISQIGGVVMYLTVVPLHMTLKTMALTSASLAVFLGAPLGAIHWSPPEEREEDDV